jgi:hypothetical protein
LDYSPLVFPIHWQEKIKLAIISFVEKIIETEHVRNEDVLQNQRGEEYSKNNKKEGV